MTLAFLAVLWLVVSIVLVAGDLVAERKERARRRSDFARLEALLGPTLRRWEEELRAEGVEVPPPARRLD